MTQDARHLRHPDMLERRIPDDHLAEAAPLFYWSAPAPLRLDAPVAGKDDAIEVYLNEDRWIAECPDCHSAQLAAREDPRFLCHECANESIGGKWRRVIWPGARDLDRIEAAVAERPAGNRHWIPGETVTQLKLENAIHRAEMEG